MSEAKEQDNNNKNNNNNIIIDYCKQLLQSKLTIKEKRIEISNCFKEEIIKEILCKLDLKTIKIILHKITTEEYTLEKESTRQILYLCMHALDYNKYQNEILIFMIPSMYNKDLNKEELKAYLEK